MVTAINIFAPQTNLISSNEPLGDQKIAILQYSTRTNDLICFCSANFLTSWTTDEMIAYAMPVLRGPHIPPNHESTQMITKFSLLIHNIVGNIALRFYHYNTKNNVTSAFAMDQTDNAYCVIFDRR